MPDSDASEHGMWRPHPAPGEVLDLLDDLYGMDRAAFVDHSFWERADSGSVWITSAVATAETLPPALCGDRTCFGIGLRVHRGGDQRWLLSTGFLRRFGHLATKGVLDLDHDAADAFMQGHVQPIVSPDGDGFHIVRHEGLVLGRGLVRDGELQCQIKKSQRGPI